MYSERLHRAGNILLLEYLLADVHGICNTSPQNLGRGLDTVNQQTKVLPI